MHIDRIEANNFKSLVDFKVDLSHFSCLIGLNGAGKSTILHFVDFLGQLMRGDLKSWLKDRSWSTKDLVSRVEPRKKNIDFSLSLRSSQGATGVSWSGTFNPTLLQCTSETILASGSTLKVENSHVRIMDGFSHDPTKQDYLDERIAFSYEGSILSQLKEDVLPGSLKGFRDILMTIKSLDLLSPEYLRQRTREAAGSLGLGGQRLSAFLYELGPKGRQALVERLNKAYPQLKNLHARSLRSGWKQLEIDEQFGETVLRTEARHINDGMLRLMAIFAELETATRFLLFDEIENGINPELVELVVQALVHARQQIVVTTHSPMILNYLDDQIARAGVIYLYKTDHGHTRAIPFFSIPSVREKLSVMGPGEAFVDTNLPALAEEIHELTGAQ